MHFTGEVDVLAISDKRKIDGTLDNEDICAQYVSIGTICWPMIANKELKEESAW